MAQERIHSINYPLTYTAPQQVSIGSKSTEILAENTARRYACIVNDSNEDIYLAIGADAVEHRGIRINAAGGVFEMTLVNMSVQAINGICASGSKIVTIQEAE